MVLIRVGWSGERGIWVILGHLGRILVASGWLKRALAARHSHSHVHGHSHSHSHSHTQRQSEPQHQPQPHAGWTTKGAAEPQNPCTEQKSVHGVGSTDLLFEYFWGKSVQEIRADLECSETGIVYKNIAEEYISKIRAENLCTNPCTIS